MLISDANVNGSVDQLCQHSVGTFGSKWPVDGSTSKGGYAKYWRGQGHWVIPIPESLPSDIAAPLLCGGITTYTPLAQHNAGPGTSVGIIGVGGLGHMGIISAKLRGCDKIYAISRTSAKKEDALKMGATDFIATEEEKDWATKYAGKLDLIVCTLSVPTMPLQQYLSLLKFRGKFVQVGAPEDNLPPFHGMYYLVPVFTVVRLID